MARFTLSVREGREPHGSGLTIRRAGLALGLGLLIPFVPVPAAFAQSAQESPPPAPTSPPAPDTAPATSDSAPTTTPNSAPASTPGSVPAETAPPTTPKSEPAADQAAKPSPEQSKTPTAGAEPTEPPAEPGALTSAATGERAAAYQSFSDHFAARRFAEALPAAEQVVKLTEKEFPAESEELINPLLNLGTTQMRMGNMYAAESAYRRALRIAESHGGGYSRSVIEPLYALGVIYHASGRYETAAESLRRAVDVSRKLDGLFNIEQLPLVESLVESYIALDKRAEVDREQQYAMRLSENTYGRNDPRMLPVLERNAAWCESTGRYRMARQAHARSLEILGRTAGKRDPAVVGPLRGIARTYRLEFLYGSAEQTDVGQAREFNPSLNSAVGGIPGADDPRPTRLDPDGENALKLALSVVGDRPDLTGAKGETLLDLGDWYMLSSRQVEAQRLYREAWAALTAPNGPGPALMSTPSQLFYRPPTSSVKRPDKDEDEVKQSFVEVAFNVGADGRVTDVKTVETDGTETQEKSVQASIRRARYRPRFENGMAVATTGVHHRQTLYSSIQPKPPAPKPTA